MHLLIFVIEDDPDYAELLKYQLHRFSGPPIRHFGTGEEALAHLDEAPDLVFLDIVLPGLSGLDVLRQIKQAQPDLPVAMVSAQTDVNVALEAMRLGAYDYVTKGHDDTVKIRAIAGHIAERAALVREVDTLRAQLPARHGLEHIVGESAAMAKVFRLIQKVLRGDLIVAIMGESGTGKELVAKAIHHNSKRRRGPFVVVNCAAIPRDLMESEFFGHEKGSFTGAYARKIGKFEQADGGTIFLDEIGELNLDLQAKLLRALQNREITRVGGNDTITFDARVISATNKDIIQMIRGGTFREDLYYRLFQFPIQLPPLRERSQDILLLAHHFMKEYIQTYPEFKGKRLSSQARKTILDFSWPGNVRELKSAIERAILISDEPDIRPSDLMLHNEARISPWAERVTLAEAARGRPAAPRRASNGLGPTGNDTNGIVLGDDNQEIFSLDDLKRQAIERAYRICDGNVDKAAVELGIGRATMYRFLKKYGIKED